MKVLTLEKSPATRELAETLKQEFSSAYSYKLFGLDREQSIIVRKSPFVGVQVSKKGNEVSIQGITPSIASWSLLYADMLITGGAPFMSLFFGSSWDKLEKEIAVFLKHKYI